MATRGRPVPVASKPPASDKQRPAARSVASKVALPKVAFPKKAHPPTDAEFAARLPAPVGKRFATIRTYLSKQGASEDLYYYGPRTGWAYRYLQGEISLCSIVIQAGRLVGIVALDAATQARISWDTLSDVARRARRAAHGTPELLWLDVALDGNGATDFKSLLKAKLAK